MTKTILLTSSVLVGALLIACCISDSYTAQQYSKMVYQEMYEGSDTKAVSLSKEYVDKYNNAESKYMFVLTKFVAGADCQQTLDETTKLAREHKFESVYLLAGIKDELDRHCEKTQKFSKDYQSLLTLIPL